MQLEGRAEKMQVLQDELENEFEVVGSTAIEDKLQVDVGSTIEAIKNAGIKVWVLTGDKIETAINIGYSCKLLNNSMKQHLIDEKEERMIRNALDETLLEMQPSSHPTKGVVQNAGPNGFQALMGGGSLTNIGTNRFDQ
jgi:phospholipid-transporting ATPase